MEWKPINVDTADTGKAELVAVPTTPAEFYSAWQPKMCDEQQPLQCLQVSFAHVHRQRFIDLCKDSWHIMKLFFQACEFN
jgi:hypothetical protein